MGEISRFQQLARPFLRIEQHYVSMHFNALELQSRMRIESPNDLEVPYTKTMMGFLLMNARPKHILMVGLGGGSLAKYCYCHFPETKITVVEINPHVIHFREHFLIPPDDQRFEVICMDAVDYVREAKQEFDVLLLDGFDDNGQVATLCSRHFYENCMRVMAEDGVLVANFDGAHPAHSMFVGRLGNVFKDNIFEVTVPLRDNRIVLAQKGLRVRPLDISVSEALSHHPSVVQDHLNDELADILEQMAELPRIF